MRGPTSPTTRAVDTLICACDIPLCVPHSRRNARLSFAVQLNKVLSDSLPFRLTLHMAHATCLQANTTHSANNNFPSKTQARPRHSDSLRRETTAYEQRTRYRSPTEQTTAHSRKLNTRDRASINIQLELDKTRDKTRDR